MLNSKISFSFFILVAAMSSISFFHITSSFVTQKEAVIPSSHKDSMDACEEMGIEQQDYVSKSFVHYGFFPAVEKEGTIGISDEKPLDSPSDNIFHVILNDKLRGTEKVWLVYELKGVQDHSNVSRSINDQLAVGGYLVKKSETWIQQKELLNPDWIKQGDNVFRFSLPFGASYDYQIRNLGLQIESGSSTSVEPQIIITQPSFHYNAQAYLKGFLQGEGYEKAKLWVDNQSVDLFEGSFEVLLKKPETVKDKWAFNIKALFPKKGFVQKEIIFDAGAPFDYTYDLSKKLVSTEAAYDPKKFTRLTLNGAKLEVPPAALIKTQKLSIIALRNEDLPALNPGMVNVTAYHEGYRFLPDGTKFGKAVKIELAYDEDKIPHGFAPEDIKTFFFDEQNHTWTALQRDTVDEETHRIISLSNHFTDMINAVIQVPESPETGALTPTSIKDLKVADPAAAVTLMDVPMANNMGSATTVLPIKLPAGRQGLQPELALRYNSEGGHSWVGLGWDLSIPSITIDTRWGVPRFNNGKETETYLLNGEQLFPTAHRKELEGRTTGDKQFWPRVEGAFNKIIRHGKNPTEYWGEVTDKNGVRYFYGGKPGSNVIKDAVLADDKGNIGYWTLLEVRDLYGNFIKYNYGHVNHPGLAGGTVMGDQLYVDNIIYTGHGSEDGKYKILFTRDRETDNFQERKDVDINARLGFKRVTADLLKKIEIKLDNQHIRSYELDYKEGAFYKTLLTSISEFDAAGQLFNTHKLDYFDEVRVNNKYDPLSVAKNWVPQFDNIDAKFLNPLDGFDGRVSSLSGTKSDDFGFGMAITVGPADGVSIMKSNTIGGHFGYAESENEGLITMIDLNGDGLPDKVFTNGSELLYRPNLSGPNNDSSFGASVTILGTNGNYFREKSRMKSDGVEAHAGYLNIAGFVGRSTNSTESVTSVYFEDVNGDQLLDLVANGQVFFNHLDSLTNHPTFTKFSTDTPSPVGEINSLDTAFGELNPEIERKNITENPLHDIVRMWRAPFEGNIRINGQVKLLQDTSLRRRSYETADGVRATIQLEDTEKWRSDTISNYNPISHSINLFIRKGQRIFFRVQSIFDGAYDQIEWDPAIEYQVSDLIKDSVDFNNKSIYKYRPSEDFILSAPISITVPIDGVLRFAGSFKKNRTTDDVRLELWKSEPGVFPAKQFLVDSVSFAWNNIVDTTYVFEDTVQTGDEFWFKLTSKTNIEWSAVNWKPNIYYVKSFNANFPDTLIINSRDTLLQFFPIVDYSIYPDELKGTTLWRQAFIDSQTVVIKPNLTYDYPIFVPRILDTIDVNFSAKRRDKAPVSKILKFFKDEIINLSEGILTLEDVKRGEEVLIEYHTADRRLENFLSKSRADVTCRRLIGGIPLTVMDDWPVAFNIAKYKEYRDPPNDNEEKTILFGPLYRGWGHFIYNGNPGRDTLPINLTLLKLDNNLTKNPERDTANAYGPANSLFVMLIPYQEEAAWKGYDKHAYIKAAIMSSSRMGQDYPRQSSPIPLNRGPIRAINKISENESTSYAAGGGAAAGFSLNGSYSRTNATTRVITDFMDLNGDLYPDIVSLNKIQYTTAQGTLADTAVFIPDFGVSHESSSKADGITLGGTYILSKGKTGKTDPKKITFQTGDGPSSVGLNVNFGNGSDNSVYSLSDINGDGLPDRIYEAGLVSLNLGYKFAQPENWTYKAIRDGESESFGAGLGINIGNASIMAGYGLSRSESMVNRILQDINGDGLLDEIVDKDSLDLSTGFPIAYDQPLEIKLNTGNGFLGNFPWGEAKTINRGSSSSESLNAAYTGCINIPFLFIKICFNPSENVGQNASRELSAIRDINGDGYPDYLTSNADNNLTVSLSKIGRTNKLKSIHRPLGSTIAINYKRVGNTYAMPNSVWTLDSVEVFDGYVGYGADRMLTTFAYENGFYDRHEREFYGFATVRTRQHDTQNRDSLYRTYVQNFNNKNYYEKGLLTSEFLEDKNGNKFTETVNTYQLQDIQTGNALPTTFVKDDAGAAFPALTSVEKRFYEGQATAKKSTFFNYKYDKFGNPIFYQDLGDNTSDDDLSATITYHNILDKYIVGKADSMLVRGGSSGRTFRKRKAEINPITGDVTKISQYLENGTVATYDMTYDTYGNLETITRPKNQNGEQLSFTYAYDSLVHTYTTRVSDSYGYSSSATYDLRFGQMLSSTDMNGQIIKYEIDNLGRITKITAPYEIANGVDYTIKHEYHPDATVPWARTLHYDPAHPDNPIETVIFIDGLAREIQVKKDASIFVGEGMEDVEQMIVSGDDLFDAFGRTTQSKYPVTESKGNESTINSTVDGIAPTVTTYDILDRPLTIKLPDGALTQTIYTFGNDRNGNLQFLTKVTDPNGNFKEQFTDVRGRQVAMKDYLEDGSDFIWTSFAYNAINELIKVTDHQNNEIISEYDWLGRRTKRIHPDAGTTEYKYDLASNITARITENLRKTRPGIAIEYFYDRERLKEIRYPLNPRNNVSYEYGDPSETFNRAGRIRKQKDATGEQAFFYGRLGEVVKNIRTIRLENGQSRTFTTRWTYDTWNRVTSMVYPDMEILTYNYNVGGKLHSLSGSKRDFEYKYVTQVGYDKFEQKVFQLQGNGTKCTYDYEPDRRRLSHMVATTRLARAMMDNTYKYDKVTNILSIKNNAPLPELNQLGGAAEYKFEYDDLYRLTKAQGTWKNKITTQRYGLEMEYNKLHDITKKQQYQQRRQTNRPGWITSNLTTYDFDYKYDSDQPHAATQIGDQTYQYDGNGNMISRVDDVFFGQKRALFWDEEDRLMALDDDERRHVYSYDADDQRVIKRKDVGQFIYINGELVTQSENLGDYTVYVSPQLVINAAGYTKHIFTENQRITSKLGLGGPFGLGSNWGDWEHWSYWNPWDNLANEADWDKIDSPYYPRDSIPDDDTWGDWGHARELYEYYYHPDHLGSTGFITDALGEVHQHMEYMPYGEIFVEESRNIDRSSYLFNGKELDEETGLYYYGARYYEPQISRWLSVDAMAEKYPGWSPFNYTLNNPINLVDPDGKEPKWTFFWRSRWILDIGLSYKTKGNSAGISLLNARFKYDTDRSESLKENSRFSTELFADIQGTYKNHTFQYRKMFYDSENEYGFNSNKLIFERKTASFGDDDKMPLSIAGMDIALPKMYFVGRGTYEADGLGSSTEATTGFESRIIGVRSSNKWLPFNFELKSRLETGFKVVDKNNDTLIKVEDPNKETSFFHLLFNINNE